MDWSDFEAVERHILAGAPAAHWKLIEVRLRLAREQLASGVNVAADLAALEREVAFASARRTKGEPKLDA